MKIKHIFLIGAMFFAFSPFMFAEKAEAATGCLYNYLPDKDVPKVQAIKQPASRPQQINYGSPMKRAMYRGSEIWTSPQNIRYISNGGAFSDGKAENDITIQHNYVNNSNDILSGSMKNISRKGYTFARWNFSNGTQSSDSKYFPQDVLYNSLEAAAKWNIITYQINYNLNNGHGNYPTSYNVESPAFTLANPSRDGWIFTGWTGSNGTTPQKNVTINKGSVGDLSFTANWKEGKFTTTFNAVGGTTDCKEKITIYNRQNTLPNASRNGYIFKGWFTRSNGGSKIGEAGERYTQQPHDTTYYAQWYKIPKVTINCDKIGSDGHVANGTTSLTFTIKADSDERFKINARDTYNNAFEYTGTQYYNPGQQGIIKMNGLSSGQHLLIVQLVGESGYKVYDSKFFFIGSLTGSGGQSGLSLKSTEVDVVDPGVTVNGQYMAWIKGFTINVPQISGHHSGNMDWMRVEGITKDGKLETICYFNTDDGYCYVRAYENGSGNWTGSSSSGSFSWNPARYIKLQWHYHNDHKGCARSSTGTCGYSVEYEIFNSDNKQLEVLFN